MAVWNLAEAQRSFYASRPRSKLLPKYRQNETETTTDGLVNRWGEEGSVPESSTGINNRNQEVRIKMIFLNFFKNFCLIIYFLFYSLMELYMKIKNSSTESPNGQRIGNRFGLKIVVIFQR